MVEGSPNGDNQKPIAVEEKAYAAMQFYATNYETLYFKMLTPGKQLEPLGPEPPVCRFCGKKEPDVKFSKDAHVVPAFVGNKVLFSRYECDCCNARFSFFEDDLAKMTMGDRALGQVPKRKGFTSLKPQGKKSSFERGATGVIIKQYVDEGTFTIDKSDSKLVVKYETQPYRQLGAYKALAKMAYTLLPDKELSKVKELRDWLMRSDVDTDRVYRTGSHWCLQTFVPGPAPFPAPIVALLKRKESVEAPYLMFFIAFGNWSYQIFVPCPEMDAVLSDKRLRYFMYPHLYLLQPWSAPGKVQLFHLTLDESSRRSEERTLKMHFDSLRKNDLAPGCPGDTE